MNTGPIVALGLVALMLLVGAIRSVYGYWSVRRDAGNEWEKIRLDQRKAAARTSEQQFLTAYKKAHSPRGLAYSTAALALAVLVTPLAVMVLTFLYAHVIVQPVDPDAPLATTVAEQVKQQFRRDGPLVYAFFLFFGLIASWGGIAYLVARRYHRDGGFGLDDELREIRGDAPLPTAKPGRKRPSWSPLVKTDKGLILDKPDNFEPGED
jgi:hypothetical protein